MPEQVNHQYLNSEFGFVNMNKILGLREECFHVEFNLKK